MSRLDDAADAAVNEVRTAISLQPLYVPLAAIALSFFVGGILIAIIGVNPFEAYWALLRGIFGSPERIGGAIARSTPFIGSALALAFAFRAGLFNIGAQGQMLAGGIAAAWVGTWSWMADVPGVLAIPIILFAGALGGFAWGGVPGVLRARTGAHEVITTIMLNSIALFMVTWLVRSRDPLILRDPDASVPRTSVITDTGILPEVFDAQPRFHWGIVVMLLCCILVAIIFERSTFGFELTTVGTNPNAAHYAGMNVNRAIVLSLAISGAFAGLAAAGEVSGTNQSFQPGTFANIGFDGIAIALLARAKPMAIIPAALLWGSLLAGAPQMQQDADVSIDVVRIILSMVLLFVAADAIVRRIFRIRGEAEKIGPAATGWAG